MPLAYGSGAGLPPDGVSRREFDELLLRFSKGAAERDPVLRAAAPKRKLHAFLAVRTA